MMRWIRIEMNRTIKIIIHLHREICKQNSMYQWSTFRNIIDSIQLSLECPPSQSILCREIFPQCIAPIRSASWQHGRTQVKSLLEKRVYFNLKFTFSTMECQITEYCNLNRLLDICVAMSHPPKRSCFVYFQVAKFNNMWWIKENLG